MTKKLVSFDDQAEPGQGLPAAVKAELNATYESLEASSARWAPGKADGRNVRNLRRPTLAVDKMFPNARHDHQIVWVDESEKIAYAISQDDRLYKSTWTAEGNEALQFTVNRSGAAVGTRWAPDGVFLRLPDGTLLMETTIGIGGLTRLVRSTDDGLTWTTVWTSPGDGKRFLGPQSVARDEKTGHLYLCEYTSETSGTTVAIYRSTDNGATWPVWVSRARSEQTTTGYLRHFHSCRYDPISERMYFTAGDNQVDAGIYRVNAAGDNIEAVLKNSDVSAQFGVSSPARAVDLMFFPDYIAWASDGSGGNQNHIYRMSRASIGTGSPVVERIAATDNTGWYAVRAAEDGSAWVVSTSTETSTSYPYNPDSGVVHLYAVTNNGAQVDDLAAVEMGGNPVGFASLSGMGGESGDGGTFWLRAHNYWFYPNRRPSSFQFRARLANGVVPVIKPSNQRQNEVVRQTFNWQGTLDPGESKVFGVTRVPAVMNFLSVLEHGAFVTTGTGGAALLEVWDGNLSIRAYASASTSWRADTNSATAERLGSVGTFTSGNRVEFRIKNTDTANPITATTNVTFGWSFL